MGMNIQTSAGVPHLIEWRNVPFQRCVSSLAARFTCMDQCMIGSMLQCLVKYAEDQ